MSQSLSKQSPDGLSREVTHALENQHAIHGLFGRVFERMGGEEFLFQWAQENPSRFLTLLTKMTPTLTPMSGIQGDVNVHVHQSLIPTQLDGEWEAVEQE